MSSNAESLSIVSAKDLTNLPETPKATASPWTAELMPKSAASPSQLSENTLTPPPPHSQISENTLTPSPPHSQLSENTLAPPSKHAQLPENTLTLKSQPDTASKSLPDLKINFHDHDEAKGPSFEDSLFKEGAEAVEIVGATAVGAAVGFTLLDASLPVAVAALGAVATGITAKALGSYMFDGGNLNTFSRNVSRDTDSVVAGLQHGANYLEQKL